MRLIQSFSDSESKSFQRFGVRKQPSVSRGSGLKLQNPAVQLISEPRDVYNSKQMDGANHEMYMTVVKIDTRIFECLLILNA